MALKLPASPATGRRQGGLWVGSTSGCGGRIRPCLGVRVLRAEELQHLVFLWLAGAAGAGDAAADRHLPDHVLQSWGEHLVRLGRIHHARVPYGWLIRYLHSTGASAFFLVVYLHMYRALLYGSYKAPRELLWLFGMFIYLALMAEPSSATCCRGATVILGGHRDRESVRHHSGIGPGWWNGSAATMASRCDAESLLLAARGCGTVVLLLLVALHLVALHEVARIIRTASRSRQEDAAAGRSTASRFILLHGEDIFGVCVFLTLFAIVVFFVPTFGDLFMEKATSSRPIRCRHPTRSRRPGTSHRITRSCARCRISASAHC